MTVSLLLEQEFNSLDAQREACEAYVTSQRHAGWIALTEMYDDGGLSGGTIERPALQRAISDLIRIKSLFIMPMLQRTLRRSPWRTTASGKPLGLVS
jgi:site-specific DNA recombinase